MDSPTVGLIILEPLISVTPNVRARSLFQLIKTIKDGPLDQYIAICRFNKSPFKPSITTLAHSQRVHPTFKVREMRAL